MGLMDKFKNLFTDEEYIEEEENDPIEIKEIKKEEEHKLPTFMREKIEKEKQENVQISPLKKEDTATDEVEIKELKLDQSKEEELPTIQKIEKNPSFKFPIDLTDNDFIETRSRQTIHNQQKVESVRPKLEPVSPKERPQKKEPKVSDLYRDKKKEEQLEKKFRATPIISPIYGVLDKNYTSGDMETSKGENLENHRHSKNVDFDSVRKKAYGNLSEEIKENLMCENCEYLKEAKECKREKKEPAVSVYEREEPAISDYQDITLDEATENYYDYGVEYQKKIEKTPSVDQDLIKIVNSEEEVLPPKKEIPPVKSSINLLSTLKKSMGDEAKVEPPKEKNLELTDDLFNLIDSMYDERNDSSD